MREMEKGKDSKWACREREEREIENFVYFIRETKKFQTLGGNGEVRQRGGVEREGKHYFNVLFKLGTRCGSASCGPSPFLWVAQT